MKKLTFIPSSTEVEELVPPPKPSKFYIPDSYKKIKNDVLKNPVFEDNKLKNSNIKQCMPFLDSLTAGYIQETWTDIHIETQNDGVCKYVWSSNPKIMSDRSHVNRDIEGTFYPVEFVWAQPWKIKLPKGYSCLIVHPLNREDLPFQTLSGVIDSDQYYHSTFGNIPFYLKKDFQGLIPAGTPMFQIIPFKRDNWESDTVEYSDKEQRILSNELSKKFFGVYKHKFWQTKSFN
jgi:hypothetical protein